MVGEIYSKTYRLQEMAEEIYSKTYRLQEMTEEINSELQIQDMNKPSLQNLSMCLLFLL